MLASFLVKSNNRKSGRLERRGDAPQVIGVETEDNRLRRNAPFLLTPANLINRLQLGACGFDDIGYAAKAAGAWLERR
jgi:hypothetical protein